MAQVKTFTAKEIAEHNTNDSLWLLIDNSVYDVTKFMDEHPGGPEPLMEYGGQEATEAFEDIGHSTDARALMKQYKIGELCEEDKKKKEKITNSGTSCFCAKILVPVGIAVAALLIYKVYTHSHK